jgi:hypothetical protein
MPVFSARADRDDKVHQVEADDDALLDPSPYRTRCDQPVLEVYNTPTPVTCPRCDSAPRTPDLDPVTAESMQADADFATEHKRPTFGDEPAPEGPDESVPKGHGGADMPRR